MGASTRTCDPYGRINTVETTPGAVCRHQAITLEGQRLIVTRNQVPRYCAGA